MKERKLRRNGSALNSNSYAISKACSPRIVTIIERIANVNKKGFSRLVHINKKRLQALGCKPEEVALFQSTNGARYLRSTSPLCKKYVVRRVYTRGRGKALIGFQLIGFNTSTHHSRSIPPRVRKAILIKYENRCIMCGSTNCLEIDHKNGRYNCASTKVDDFQVLCKSCNDKKRERCRKCIATGQRFNVQQAISPLLYKIAFTCGGARFNNRLKVGCRGCFLHDIEDFYKKNTS